MAPATARTAKAPRHAAVRAAVHQHDEFSKQGLLERAFTFAFRGLVYAQIWEDPVVDLEALQLGPGMHLVTIASGGCNVLSYLTADPARITAVDLNTAHVALGRLKLTAARHLPTQASFHRFFGEADRSENVAAYKRHVAPHLDTTSRRYWEGRDPMGRKRIGGFGSNFYRRGLLGSFIVTGQLLARAFGIDTRDMLEARSLEEQRHIFETKFAPLFDKKFVRWLTGNPAALFGLGIPPAQYKALLGDAPDMASVLKARLEKLSCDFAVSDNYFAWQAFGRGYGKGPAAPLPPYLQAENYRAVVDRVDRVDYRHMNFTDFLREQTAASCDRYVLLDAQDWMTDTQLTELWREITRTARPGARVLFRTAAEPTLLPGRVPPAILDRWHYAEAESARFTREDRSSIYGGVHLYILKDA
ncbi:S-adenosylmethionine--diacylglycerol 3-amino-3-carboxypropyl transferase [alpha proteobacterium AAP81b]|nr:S-adenosylmethionine--diacylglycerol 3-amino-3-carboxypropyl transferase [alpha proteobacterium AAP81b]